MTQSPAFRPALALALWGLAAVFAPLPARALEKKDVRAETLPNGLRILFVRTAGSPRMACRIAYSLGSDRDPRGREGMAALVARTTFFGTTRLGSRDYKTERDIFRRIDDYEEILAREKVDPALVERLTAIPLEIRKAEESLRRALAKLGSGDRTPMSKDEMDRIRAFVKDQESRKEKLEDELARLKATSDYFRLQTRKTIEKKIKELRAEQTSLVDLGETMRVYHLAGGTDVGCAVGPDHTLFRVNLPANRFETFLWVESDRMRNAVFRGFYEERDRRAARLALEEAHPARGYGRELPALAYLHHPYGRPAAGFPASLSSISREEAAAFYRSHYAPSRAVLVLVGDTEAVNLLSKATAYFKFTPTGTAPRPPPSIRPRQAGVRRLVVRTEGANRVDFLYPAPAHGHRDRPAMDLVAACLAARSGRLQQDLVGRNLASDVRVRYVPRALLGSFRVTAWPAPGVSCAKLEKAMETTMGNLARWGFTVEEVSGATSRLRARWGRTVLDPDRLATTLALAEARGGWLHLLEAQEAWSSSGTRELKAVFQAYLTPRTLTVGVLEADE